MTRPFSSVRGALGSGNSRFESAAKRYDHEAAQRTVQLVADFGLPRQLGTDFAGRLQKMPRMGAVLPEGGVLRASEEGAVAVSRAAVTRADYARFVEATRRAPSLCRERALNRHARWALNVLERCTDARYQLSAAARR